MGSPSLSFCLVYQQHRSPLASALAQSVAGCNDASCSSPRHLATNQQNDIGFSISVDGEIIDGSDTLAAEQRRADIDLNQVDIQVKFDGLDVKPVLNVSTSDLRRGYKAGELISFQRHTQTIQHGLYPLR